ncbi:MAG: hypothetical protein JW809_12505 [Pirellulales bacterium]|nr:hypothetical protein [Pirellulales bacterium]
MKRLAALGAIIVLLAAGPAVASITVGNSLVDRGITDTATGYVFVLGTQPSEAVGNIVTSWAFFDDETGGATVDGRLVTPLIFNKVGSLFQIAGIGTTRATDRGGIQEFAFDLVSGSALIGPDSYLGWRDGNIDGTVVNQGVIEFEWESDPSTYEPYTGIVYRGNPGALLVPGAAFAGTADGRRTYSVQFTAVPEPASLAVWSLLAAAGLVWTVRRRQR